MTLDQHASVARREPGKGMPALVAALQADPALVAETRERLARYAAMDQAGRMEACWISRTTRETLLAALAAANT